MPDPSSQQDTDGSGHRPVGAVAVLGSSGFVGGAVTAELRARGIKVRPIVAPRLRWPRYFHDGMGPLALDNLHNRVIETLGQQLSGVDAVVNAAGIAEGNAPASAALLGANALLPLLTARATALIGVDRFIHVSSAAVQGAAALDETTQTAPFSPYSHSKALGERLLLREEDIEPVIFRSTWVHDVGRSNTQAVIRVARSPLSCVAGEGLAPTPQVLIGDVAAAVTNLALVQGPVPSVVLQPPNGMTTGLLLQLLSGREPRHLPERAARRVVSGIRACVRLSQWGTAPARRLEMLLFGKPQTPGWLAGQGLVPPLCHDEWERLADL